VATTVAEQEEATAAEQEEATAAEQEEATAAAVRAAMVLRQARAMTLGLVRPRRLRKRPTQEQPLLMRKAPLLASCVRPGLP
jgi:hypothetical protein